MADQILTTLDSDHDAKLELKEFLDFVSGKNEKSVNISSQKFIEPLTTEVDHLD